MATPAAAPMRALALALVEELPSDADTMRQLLGFDEPDVAFSMVKKWRETHLEAVLVLDQFEELFTLNLPEVQERFAGLLGRLAREADVHVLLSMRDDFLMRCHEQEPLDQVFAAPHAAVIPRRGGTAPALCWSRRSARASPSRTTRLVDEMLESVEGARGALPLLAFAVARLWEKRDREARLLTRRAYEEIGGVAGALAQHAEQTLERIGASREPIVRELFRNLVTAQWTRAVADREQLLSVLPDKDAGAPVLDALIDARLLTAYELNASRVTADHSSATRATRQQVEIVHESLLRAWPRLVRWQAQDEEGAVLRDQLKQAAHLWEEKGRTDDLLWTGTSAREFELWRDRYPGKLTALEEEYSRAMVDRTRTRKRLRRVAGVTLVAGLAIVATVTGALWKQAQDEALRAEAGKLLALAKVTLEDDSTAALAYARGSLGLHDTPEARRFALEVLWRGPVARLLDLSRAASGLGLPAVPERSGGLFFSPDGRWLSGGALKGRILLFDRDGSAPRTLPTPSGPVSVLAFGPRSDLLVTGGPGPSLKFWSLPDLREQRTVPISSASHGWGSALDSNIVLYTKASPGDGWSLQVMEFADEGPRLRATILPGEWLLGGVDSEATHTVVVRPPRNVALLSLDGTSRRRPLGELPADLRGAAVSPRGDLVAASDASGQAHVWSRAEGDWRVLRTLQGPEYSGTTLTFFDLQGRRLNQAGPSGSHVLWDLEEFPDAQPLVLGRPGPIDQRQGNFDPGGRWLAAGNAVRTTIEFWPVATPWRRVLPGFAAAHSLAFSPDSRWLISCPVWQPARRWPLKARDGDAETFAAEEACHWVAAHPAGRGVLVGTISEPKVLLYPSPGGAPRRLIEEWDGATFFTVAFDHEGRRAVAVPGNARGGIEAPESRALVTWDLASGEKRTHSIAHLTDESFFAWSLAFAPDGRLYVGGQGGVRRLNLPTEAGGILSSEMIHAAGVAHPGLDREGRQLIVWANQKSRVFRDPHEELLLFDLASGTSRPITTHGRRVSRALLSPSGHAIVTGDHDGVVRVGPTSGEEPHLLLGHKSPVTSLAISPDERWIASSSDEAISIWPMPDVTEPPLHTLPHEELTAKLDALTNLRVVRDPSSPTGWSEEIGPFPGWKDVPTW